MHRLDTLDANEILSQPSGLYSGTNSSGIKVIITRQVGHGFVIMTPSRTGWYECNEYDESGNLVGTTYEN